MRILLFLLCFTFAGACATTNISKLVPDKKQAAAVAVCAVIEAGDCFDEPVLQSALPGIDSGNCTELISSADFKRVRISDFDKLKEFSCKDKLFKTIKDLRKYAATQSNNGRKTHSKDTVVSNFNCYESAFSAINKLRYAPNEDHSSRWILSKFEGGYKPDIEQDPQNSDRT